MKLTDPQIKITNSAGQIRSRNFPVSNAVTTAHISYKEGAEAMAQMFRDAIRSRNMRALLELANATETNSFYEYQLTNQP